ncbi:flagellar hook-associated protein 3 FlgL [Natranaerovirga pectinivora]|uniref:Flagellar hook-associated protein 3 FlgL n=1 Tax=Natranaerovirga pectinivora TaxID=682400 RepID=A0A4R3MKA8_9FIRM|nr:flagellar hook-associated protein FlgL [Natranaerovirga pectinivora]TCT14016.1 flagellar hook-associated protein 3 FlgL [Natranaerovirga pectinivora]
MRITNSMVRNNTLLNLNRNRLALSQLEQQMATGKKIQKPSEDPIIAVRAIKLRSNVREVAQYRSNINDALSWMGVTEQAAVNINDILKRVRDLCVQGSNDTLGVGEREKVVQELEQLKFQIQQEGNVNYAGRFVFTGFKTDKPLIFNRDNNETYEITQRLNSKDIEKKAYVKEGTPPAMAETFRIRLAYAGLGEAATPITEIPTKTPPALNVINLTSEEANAYEPNPGEVIFLKDTGELIFNEVDIDNINDTFTFTYDKTGFKKNDLNPEHYFNVKHKVDPSDDTTWVTYNENNEKINYQISYNQDINVNTLGKDLITHTMIRDIEELISAVINIPEEDSVKKTLLEDQLGQKFGNMLSRVDKHLKTVVGEVAELGSRMNRLELTNNRLENDLLNFTDLMSQNEDVDIAEVVVSMQSRELVYTASLMASSKILQPSLLDFLR